MVPRTALKHRSWTKPRQPRGESYIQLTVRGVTVGGHYGSGATDNAGTCSHSAFVAGRYNDLVLKEFGAEVLDEVLRELGAAADPHETPSVASPQTQSLPSAATKNPLADLRERMAATARRTYRFDLDDGDSGPQASKFGGCPGLLEGEPWPSPLRFFAQIDFAALPQQAQERCGKRMLQVFIAEDVSPFRSGGTLIRWVDSVDLETTTPPDGVALFAEKRVVAFKQAVEEYPRREYGLAQYDALTEDERQLLRGANHAGDKVGGWPHWIQDPSYARCPKCKTRMDQLVLQIDSHHAVAFSFGDNGAAYILRCPEHADELSFTFQCT